MQILKPEGKEKSHNSNGSIKYIGEVSGKAFSNGRMFVIINCYKAYCSDEVFGFVNTYIRRKRLFLFITRNLNKRMLLYYDEK